MAAPPPTARRFPAVSAVLATLTFPPGASAQEVDRNVVRLEWGALNILVITDTLNGMGLWAAWTAAGERQGMKEDQFVAHFDPDAVQSWLDEVGLVMGPDRVSADDPAQLQTPPLIDLLGGRLYAVRLKDGNRWSKRVYFSMSYDPREKPLQFAVEQRNATRLLETVTAGARDSRLVTAPLPGHVRLYANPADPSTFPQGAGVYGVVYPQHLVEQRIQGDVWFSFVVDSTGHVRVDESLRVLLSDHPLLTQTARESVRDGEYRPAMRQGRPVAVRIYQRVTYRIRNWGTTAQVERRGGLSPRARIGESTRRSALPLPAAAARRFTGESRAASSLADLTRRG